MTQPPLRISLMEACQVGPQLPTGPLEAESCSESRGMQGSRVAISDFGSEAPRSAVQPGLIGKLVTSHKGVRIEFDQERKQGRGYYEELCFKIFATTSAGSEQELVDGGDVNWTQKLLNNAKER
jgi:hypothetical protein